MELHLFTLHSIQSNILTTCKSCLMPDREKKAINCVGNLHPLGQAIIVGLPAVDHGGCMETTVVDHSGMYGDNCSRSLGDVWKDL